MEVAKTTKDMYVVCLEGCHGVGKSSLINALADKGFRTLDEAFLDMPAYCLHPQTLTMETVWVTNWFMRLLKLKHDVEEGRERAAPIFFADRSPYSAIFYSRTPEGAGLKPIIDSMVAELARLSHIYIITVYISCDRDTLWSRILNRLAHDETRRLFGEDKREWMDETVNWYESFKWDMTIDNGTVTSTQCAPSLITKLCLTNPKFEACLKGATKEMVGCLEQHKDGDDDVTF